MTQWTGKQMQRNSSLSKTLHRLQEAQENRNSQRQRRVKRATYYFNVISD